MHHTSLLSWRHALLTGLGLVTACGGNTDSSSSGSDGVNSAGETATGGDGGEVISGSGGSNSTGAGGATGRGGSVGVGGGPRGGSSPGGSSSSGGFSVGGFSNGGAPPGVLHRPAPARCAPHVARTEPVVDLAQLGDAGLNQGNYMCVYDSECTERDHGYCSVYSFQIAGSNCAYGCATDADCAAGTVCDCSGIANQCVTAGCTTDADCPGAALCLRTDHDDGCGSRVQYHCQSAADGCITDADCAAGTGCAYSDYEGRHLCEGVMCAIGRPFLVGGSERLADPCSRRDWADAPDLRSMELDRLQAATLAERWTRIGLMEHASVAAFARFALQLLSLGAPPDLVEACTRAMSDETRHATIAFGLASRYGGLPVGPGALAIDGALADDSLEDIVVNVVREGCIGETVAAMEAETAAARAQDPTVRDILLGISADERRHAELAWRFVDWATRDRPELRASLVALVDVELTAARRAQPQPMEDDGWLAEYGLLPEAARAALRGSVLQDLVAPCMAALSDAARRAA